MPLNRNDICSIFFYFGAACNHLSASSGPNLERAWSNQSAFWSLLRPLFDPKLERRRADAEPDSTSKQPRAGPLKVAFQCRVGASLP